MNTAPRVWLINERSNPATIFANGSPGSQRELTKDRKRQSEGQRKKGPTATCARRAGNVKFRSFFYIGTHESGVPYHDYGASWSPLTGVGT